MHAIETIIQRYIRRSRLLEKKKRGRKMFSKGKIIRLNKNPLSLVVIRKREEKIHENLYIQYSVKESKRFEIRKSSPIFCQRNIHSRISKIHVSLHFKEKIFDSRYPFERRLNATRKSSSNKIEQSVPRIDFLHSKKYPVEGIFTECIKKFHV